MYPSYPEGFSINDGIAEEFKHVQYQSIDHAIEITRKYKKGVFMLNATFSIHIKLYLFINFLNIC